MDRPRMALVALALLPSAVLAHHGVSSYEMSVVRTLDGTVARWDFEQPHTWLAVAVDGVEWQIEGAPPRWMSGQGFTPASLTVGEDVTVTYHPHRRTLNAGILMEVRRADGTVLKVNRPASLGGP